MIKKENTNQTFKAQSLLFIHVRSSQQDIAELSAPETGRPNIELLFYLKHAFHQSEGSR